MTASRLLPNRLLHHARTQGERDAVHFVPEHGERRVLTYRGLSDLAERIARQLHRRGVEEEPVLVMLPNGVEFAAALIGCMRARAAAVPMPLPGRFARQWHRSTGIAADAGARFVLTDAAHVDEVRDWVASMPGNPLAVLDIGELVAIDAEGDHSGMMLPEISVDDIAFLQYTSGSTSAPKGVVVTQGNLEAHARFAASALRSDGNDRFCSWLPVHHDFGLIGMLLAPIALGATVHLMSPTHFLKHPAAWFQLLSETRATVTAAPNFGHNHSIDRARRDRLAGVDLSHLRLLLNGSEPIDARTLRRFAETFGEYGLRPEALAPCYGLAEATLGVTFADDSEVVQVRTMRRSALAEGRMESAAHDDAHDAVQVVGCGTAHGVEVVVVDDEGRVQGDDRIGEIWVRGESVASRYWQNPEASALTLCAELADGSGPWLRTGDLGGIADGQLYVTGRVKEMLIINGRNLYPHDLERELQQLHPALENRPGCVVAAEHDDNSLVAILEHDPRLKSDVAALTELIGVLGRALARVSGARVANVLLVAPGSVQRTTSGKIQRSRTRDAFHADELNVTVSLHDVAPRELSGSPA